MTLREMRQKLEALKAELRALLDAVDSRDDKTFTDEERASYDAKKTEADKLADDIRRHEELDELDRRTAGDEGPGERSGVRGGHDRSEDRPFQSFGEFLRSVATSSVPGNTYDPRLRSYNERAAASGMAEAIGPDGGFMVENDMLGGVMRRTYDTALVAGRCRRIPVSGGGIKFNSIDETSRAAGSRSGGVRAYWTAEAASMTASQPKLKRQSLDLEKLTALVYMTDELLDDAVALEAFVNATVGEELAYELDDKIITGTGAGMPLGLLNSSAPVSVAKESGQAADTIVYENIVKMWARMWAKSRANAVWFINQDCETELHTMAQVVGTGGVPVYMPAGGLAESPFATLYGRPVVPIEQCKTVGDNGDIILADMSEYLLVDKGGINTAQSMHVRFLYNEMTFRFVYRVNGMPLWDKALTPANGSNTLSPWVTLAARA